MPVYDDGSIGRYFRNLVDDTTSAAPTLSINEALSGVVMCVELVYSAMRCVVSEVAINIPAGIIRLNSADVADPTTYHVYILPTGEVVASTSDPNVIAGLEFARLSIVRFKSVGGVATVFYMRRTYCSTDRLLHNIANWDMLKVPVYLTGGAVTVNATSGAVSMEAMIYRRLRFQGDIADITNGTMILSDETTEHANLETVTTYVDGSPITAGKYHKMLLGVITSPVREYPFVLIRQDVPGTEYASLEDAIVDNERKAAVGFPLAYRGMVVPLAYIAMLVGDASDIEIVDLRQTGITGSGGGGGGGIADHSLLAGLGNDDHGQYARTDGTRAFTGALNIGGFAIANVGNVDGVDISAHVADITAHGRAYGSIYVTAGAAGQALTSGVAAKLTAYTANGLSLNTTPDHTNDQIAVTNAGNYRITGAFTFESGTASRDMSFFLAVGGVASIIGTRQECIDNGEYVAASFNGFLTLGAGAVLTVLVTVGGGNATLTMRESHLTVERL